MSEIPIGVAALEGVVLTVLTHLNNGEVDDAVTRFAGEFRFKDHGIGLEFKDKERLREFFQKTREVYPHSFLQTDTILVSGDHVIIEWTLQTTLIEPFYGALSRKVRVSLRGASIVRTDKGAGTPVHRSSQRWLRISRNGSSSERRRVLQSSININSKHSLTEIERSQETWQCKRL